MKTSAVPGSERILILEPNRVEKHYWVDLWLYRELFFILAWRDVSVRYKQTVIGIAWALIRPFLTMVVLTVIFGRVARLPSAGDAPYALMVFSAMLPWFLFSTSVGEASNSLIGNETLISKVYFPRIIVPIATVLATVVDFVISLAILIALMAYYHYPPPLSILCLPLFVLQAVLASLGLGLWFTALNVRYRDFRYAIQFALQFGLYISPVGFTSSVIPDRWRLVYSLNPVVGVIDGFRWAILGQNSPIYWPGFAVSFSTGVFFLWLGVSRFRKAEKGFADVI